MLSAYVDGHMSSSARAWSESALWHSEAEIQNVL